MKTMKKDYKSNIRKLLNSEFQEDLFESCLANLNQTNNKLRYNNFAYSIRELSRHFLKSLAPYEEVLKCNWYKNETDRKNGITRGQRIKFAIQGGLDDHFLNKNLVRIAELNHLKKQIKDAINLLSKYTHIQEKTFDISDEKGSELVNNVLKKFYLFAITIENSRNMILDALNEKIDRKIIDHALLNSLDELDELSTHTTVNSITPENYNVSMINSGSIEISVTGSVVAELQYGSNSDIRKDDGYTTSDSFTFYSVINSELSDTLPNSEVEIREFRVDTDSFFE